MNVTPVDPARMANRFASRFAIPYNDALQDVRLSILEHTQLYSTLTDPPDCDFHRWLYNKVWQQLRHRYKRRRLGRIKETPVSAVDEDEDTSRFFAEAAVDVDAVIDVQEALKLLPDNYRELLTAVCIEGRLASEYAAIKGITQTAVSHMWKRASAAMRALLPEYAL